MRNYVYIAFVFVMLSLLTSCSSGYIVVDRDLKIYKTIKGAMNEETEDILVELRKGDKLKVLHCNDEKSYFILEVELNKETKGFVLYGSFTLDTHLFCI